MFSDNFEYDVCINEKEYSYVKRHFAVCRKSLSACDGLIPCCDSEVTNYFLVILHTLCIFVLWYVVFPLNYFCHNVLL